MCSAQFSKMVALDILGFIKGTCFSECGADMMTSECRRTIVNNAKEYCQLKLAYPSEDEQ
jgi:hypothetical protein